MIYISEASEIILGAVDEAINRYQSTAPFDKSIKGRVIKIIGKDTYSVLINGQEYSVRTSTDNMDVKVNDQVWITIPQNKWDSMFILSLAPIIQY